jgi:hypothetical protein
VANAMRRVLLISLCVLEVGIAGLLLRLAAQLPERSSVEKTFAKAQDVTEHAGQGVQRIRNQMSLLRRPELEKMALDLQEQMKKVTPLLRDRRLDFNIIAAMRDGIGGISEGLMLARTLDAAYLDQLGDALGTKADFLENELLPAVEAANKQFDKSAAGLAKNAEAAASLLQELADEAAVQKKNGELGKALKELPKQAAELAKDLPKLGQDLADVLKVAGKLRDVVKSLRKAQQDLKTSAKDWPKLQETVLASANILQSARKQLDAALDQRKPYESTMDRVTTLADGIASLLPVLSQQMIMQVEEQDRFLYDLSNNLGETGESVSKWGTVLGQLAETGRWLAWLTALVVTLHAVYQLAGMRTGWLKLGGAEGRGEGGTTSRAA